VIKKRPKSKIPSRNRSPFGWWVASYIERFEWKSEDRTKLKRRCLAWENTVLIKAKDREVAYQKARSIRKTYSPEWRNYGNHPGRPGRWVFEGLTSLLAIYEKLEDGAEIIWNEHADRTVEKIRSFVKKKSELETFIDD
jgi:hypothetical protein